MNKYDNIEILQKYFFLVTFLLHDLFTKKLNDDQFNNFLKLSKNKNFKKSLLLQTLEDKGFELEYISKNIRISLVKLRNYFKNKDNLTQKQFQRLCNFANLDARLFLELKHEEDGVGKLYVSHKDSIKTIRKYKSYTIASIVSSTRFQDLHGYYMKVDKKEKKKLNLTC